VRGENLDKRSEIGSDDPVFLMVDDDSSVLSQLLCSLSSDEDGRFASRAHNVQGRGITWYKVATGVWP